MNRQLIGRIISVFIGAAVLYVLEQRMAVQLYIAIPIAIIVYMVVKVGLGLMWGAGNAAK